MTRFDVNNSSFSYKPSFFMHKFFFNLRWPKGIRANGHLLLNSEKVS